MALAITLLIVFVGLPVFFLFVFVYLPKSIRSKQLKKIAQDFQLTFESGIEKGKWWNTWGVEYFDKDGIKRNIMKGKIGLHSVEVFDSYKNRLNPLYIPTRGSYTIRATCIIVDGNPKEISRGVLFSGLASAKKIREGLKNVSLVTV
jgi:hypothetical protein